MANSIIFVKRFLIFSKKLKPKFITWVDFMFDEFLENIEKRT